MTVDVLTLGLGHLNFPWQENVSFFTWKLRDFYCAQFVNDILMMIKYRNIYPNHPALLCSVELNNWYFIWTRILYLLSFILCVGWKTYLFGYSCLEIIVSAWFYMRALAHCLQRRSACNTACRTACDTAPPAKSKVETRGPKNWSLERGYWTLPSTFPK